MRIAIFGMTENKGGIESVVYNIYKNINKDEIQFDFVLNHNAKKMAYEDEVIKMGARVFRIMYSQRERIFGASKVLKKFFKAHPEIEGVYLHTNYPYVFPIKIAKKVGLKYRVIHSHSSAKLYEELKGFDKIKQSFIDFFIYRDIKKTPTIRLACSDQAAQALFKKNDYSLIRNGIDLKKYIFNESIRNRIRNQFSIAEDEIVLGFVGMLGYVKNPIKAIEVFYKVYQNNKKSKLVLVGDGSLLENIKKRIKKYNIENNVILTGMISNAYEWYNAFDILLMPSLFEGFPMALVEGQTNGLKAIVSDTITEQVNVTDLLEYESINDSNIEWASKIEKTRFDINRKEYFDIMRKEGFDIENMVKEICDIAFYSL